MIYAWIIDFKADRLSLTPEQRQNSYHASSSDYDGELRFFMVLPDVVPVFIDSDYDWIPIYSNLEVYMSL